jgi:hypothetical protein
MYGDQAPYDEFVDFIYADLLKRSSLYKMTAPTLNTLLRPVSHCLKELI